MLISPPGADGSGPLSDGDVGAPPGGGPTRPPAAPPPPPLRPPPGTTGGAPLCSGDVDGAGLPTLVAPPGLWVGTGVGAGDGSDVELGAVGGGGGTGGGPLEWPPGIGGFVADDVGVQLPVSFGEDGGSLDEGGGEDSDSVEVGCSLGVGSPVSDAVGVDDGSLVDGGGSELGGPVGWCVDGGLVVAGSVEEGGGVDDGGPPGEVAGRDGFDGDWAVDVPPGFEGLSSGLEFGGQAGELVNVVGDVGQASGCGLGVGAACPVGWEACEP